MDIWFIPLFVAAKRGDQEWMSRMVAVERLIVMDNSLYRMRLFGDRWRDDGVRACRSWPMLEITEFSRTSAAVLAMHDLLTQQRGASGECHSLGKSQH
jgi:hypothetical protein